MMSTEIMTFFIILFPILVPSSAKGCKVPTMVSSYWYGKNLSFLRPQQIYQLTRELPKLLEMPSVEWEVTEYETILSVLNAVPK